MTPKRTVGEDGSLRMDASQTDCGDGGMCLAQCVCGVQALTVHTYTFNSISKTLYLYMEME